MSDPIKVGRIENVQCPICDEFTFTERDSQNLNVHPEPCACGYQFNLGDLFGNTPAMRKAEARRAGIDWIVRLFDEKEHIERGRSLLCTKLSDAETELSTLRSQLAAKDKELKGLREEIIEWRKACESARADETSWHNAAHNLNVPAWNGKAYSDPAEFAQRILDEACKIVAANEARHLAEAAKGEQLEAD